MSKLNEMLSRPATITATTRLDARFLATLALYWSEQNENCRSTSELIRFSLENLAQLLVISNKAEWIDNQERALEVLTRCGFSGLQVQRENMHRALLTEQGIDITQMGRSMDLSARAKRKKSGPAEPTVNAALAQLEANLDTDQKKDLAQRLAESESTTTEALRGLGQLPKEEEK